MYKFNNIKTNFTTNNMKRMYLVNNEKLFIGTF